MLHHKPDSELTDEDVLRELAYSHTRRHDTFLNGTAHALHTLLERTSELEAEYLRRFPADVADAADKLSLYQDIPEQRS